MSLKELNPTEIEQVAGGTFLLKAFLFSKLFHVQIPGCDVPAVKPPVEQPGEITPPVEQPGEVSPGFNNLISKWFPNFKF